MLKKSLAVSIPLTFCGVTSVFAGQPFKQSAKTSKTNVILCMADDLGWGSVGYNGSSFIKTPNLDSIASNGIKFDNFYSAAPVCSPTRASCLNGRNPYRTGVFSANQGVLRTEEVTIAEILKNYSYTCGHFGKWHLGTLTVTGKDSNRGGSKHPELFNPPTKHGFDTYFSTEAKVPTWDPMKIPVSFKGEESRKYGWHYLTSDKKFKEFGTHYWTPEGKVTENLNGDDSRIIMDRAIPFIEKAVSDKKPFLAVIWFHAPHLPVVAGPEYVQMYKDLPFKKQQYAGAVTAMDNQIGRLIKKLKELKVYDDTIFFFTSDNGPERNTPGETGGRKGRKRSLYDGGIHVPGLMLWPGKFPEHQTIKTSCVTSDYLPTILDALNIPLKENDKLHLDGCSMLPAIEHPQNKNRDISIPFVFKNQLALNDGKGYKLYKSLNNKPELYDLINDPNEKNNIADSFPEKVDEYTKRFYDWFKDVEKSFKGNEYGCESYDKIGQTWPGIYAKHKKHKKKHRRNKKK